jgi:hypothetical protein
MWKPPSGPQGPKFEALVATVNSRLESELDPGRRDVSEDPRLARHHRDFLNRQIWPLGLDKWLEHYIPWAEPNVKTLNSARDALFDEKNLPAVQLVWRRTLGGGFCTLNDLVEQIYAPQSDAYSGYRDIIKEKLLDTLTEIKVWHYEKIVEKASTSAQEYVKGYRIIGDVSLSLFDEHIYTYWYHRQNRWFRDHRPGSLD